MKLNDKGIYDGYGMWHQPFWQTTLFYSFVGFILFLIFVLSIYVVVRLYRSRFKKKVPAWKKALQDLEKLKKSIELSAYSDKEFYGELSRIVKRYVQERYGLRAVSQTDQEFIGVLQEHDFLTDLFSPLIIVFNNAQNIKFSCYETQKNTMIDDFELVRSIIKQDKATLYVPAQKIK